MFFILGPGVLGRCPCKGNCISLNSAQPCQPHKEMPCRFVRTWGSFAAHNEMWSIVSDAQRTRFPLAFFIVPSQAMLSGATWARSLHLGAVYPPGWAQCLRPKERHWSLRAFPFMRANDLGPLPSCNQFHTLLSPCSSGGFLLPVPCRKQH